MKDKKKEHRARTIKKICGTGERSRKAGGEKKSRDYEVMYFEGVSLIYNAVQVCRPQDFSEFSGLVNSKGRE